MTGFDVYNRCMALMGYTSAEGEVISGKAIIKRFPEILNQIALDLKLDEIKSLSDELPVNKAQADALILGCAMLLSISEGDVNKNQLFTSNYNGKRSAALAEASLIEDKLPTVSGGI